MAWPRLLTFTVWLAVGLAVVGWGLRLTGGVAPLAGVPPVAAESTVPAADWSPLFSASAPAGAPTPVPAAEATRYRLLGVAGPLRSEAGTGVALLSVDGGPPRALRPGQAVADQRIIQAIAADEVRIGPPDGPPTAVLQAARLPPPAASR